MTDTIESLTKTLDDLCGRAMLLEDGPAEIISLTQALGELSLRAESAGYPAFAQAAAGLSRGLPDGDSMRQGLRQLQKVLEQKQVSALDDRPYAAPASIALDPELLSEFFIESRDHLATIETKALTLEQDPGNKEAVHAIFRGYHTIKGLAGFLELDAIQSVAHEVETLLDKVRNGELTVTPEIIDVILAGSDYLRTDISRLEGLLSGGISDAPVPGYALISRVHALMAEALLAEDATLVAAPDSAPAAASLEESAEFFPLEQTPAQTPAAQPVGLAIPIDQLAIPIVPPHKAAPRKHPEPKAQETRSAEPKTSEAKGLVKVDTAKLDFLVDMVGELVIAQSMIRYDGELSSISNHQLQRNLSQLSRITGEVQKTAMSMRMVPIGQLFQKSVRLIRDLTRKSGKRAEVDIVGEDTELDRTIVDDLSDPLVHMIRNSADHGVETPDERTKAGKNPVARIGLKAYHQAGHIVVEISDDGRGLMRDKILKKAKERGLVQDGTNLNDKDVFNLIFEPGFSTAEKITDVSGRGVGMDVVRKQIQKMRGRIDIESEAGVGTKFFLKLPLTLAIIDGLVVGVGNERYILPIFAVREIFRPQPDTVFTVENRNEMVLVRGNLLPVVRLNRRFGVTPRTHEIIASVLVVTESGGRRFCLVVDELIGKQEVVIKSLGETFKNVVGVAGGAILGDGRVGLIVDMEGVFGETAHV